MNYTNFNFPLFIYGVDRTVRDDLARDFIVSERDYISTLMSYIRLLLSQKGIKSFCHSQVLPGSIEQKLGCDAILVIRNQSKVKICLFEAKYPNLNLKKTAWDNKLTNQKNPYPKKHSSRFNRQLDKQSKWSNQAAIWELFILDYYPTSQPAKFDNLGSTCIWHNEVYQYALQNKIYSPKPYWTKQDLIDFVNQPTTKTFNLEQIINTVLDCKQGIPLPVIDGFVTLSSFRSDEDDIASNDGLSEESISIPVDLESIDETLKDFLKQTGLTKFLFVQLDNQDLF